MVHYFGTDGIRGQAYKTLMPITAYKIGRYLGFYYSKNKKAKIVVAKDTRESSTDFEKNIALGIKESGGDAYLMGYASTPSLAYNTINGDFDCGVMISASHNPYTDNGIKIFGKDGQKLKDELLEPIEDYIDDKYELIKNDIGSINEYNQGILLYQNWLNGLYQLDMHGMKICVDLCNGSNCYTAKDILNNINASLTYINDSPSGTNINKNCGSTHLQMLSNIVKEGDYDMGFAFDGDADRVLFVDEDGVTFDGDKVMYLLSKYYKEHNLLTNNTLVTTVMSNIGLFKSLDKINVDYKITAVGDKNVVDCMVKDDYCVGGEQSGHVILKHDALIGDGLKTALCLLKALKYFNKSLKECSKEVVIYPQLLVNIKVRDKNVVLNDEDVNGLIENISNELGDNGRILVRPSGTEPLIRVMVEAESNDICEKDVYLVINKIKEKGYEEL